MDETKRELRVSQIMKYNDKNLVPSLLSFLIKSTFVTHDPVPLLSSARKYMRLSETKKLLDDDADMKFETLPRDFKLKLHPPPKSTQMFYVLREYRPGGDSSQVLLACSAAGNLCVLKFHRRDADEEINTVEKEVKWWNDLYGLGEGYVYCKQLGRDGCPVIVMPFAFHCSSKIGEGKHDFDLNLEQWCKYPNASNSKDVNIEFSDVSTGDFKEALRVRRKDDVATEAIKRIAAKKYQHMDLKWHHVALLPLFHKSDKTWNGSFMSILIDLTRMEDGRDEDAATSEMWDALHSLSSESL